MISGYATPEATQKYTARFERIAYSNLGDTHLSVSRFGFGCYRVSADVAAHESALVMALCGGINLIDTSANYADGGSEERVGGVIHNLTRGGRLSREEVVVITKGGYLQGNNFTMSQQRKREGHPFTDLVAVAEGLEHCIHPDFLDDQISRSLDRLGLETVDGYLLHNPEYYLEWAHQHGMSIDGARREYYRRIETAFRYLETEVQRGRIRYYGISSNTFPAASDAPDFTSLHRVWEIAASIRPGHHFRIIQFPLNLLETMAVTEKNQPDGRTLLALARGKRLGVLTNRPLNAFTGKRVVRLTDIEVRSRMDYRDIIDAIKSLAQIESRLWRKILPGIDAIPGGLKVRIKQQGCIAESLKHYWRSFGSYEHWRQARDGMYLPRIQGVIEFLTPYGAMHADLADWLTTHDKTLAHALRAVASIYADDAVALEKRIRGLIDRADDAWAGPGTLSQKAIRAPSSTRGISSVLVGMRKEAYVSDVLTEAKRPVVRADRVNSWIRLREGSDDVLPA
jgi:aryl-alcohol dehydrogenase-like predicted oxidoreductase